MSDPKPLFDINPSLDIQKLAIEFAENGRIQIREILTAESALNLREMLLRETKWGLAWQAGDDGPNSSRAEELATATPQEKTGILQQIDQAMRGNDYAFLFAQYPMLTGYQEKWDEGGPHDILMEHLNSEAYLNLVKQITGLSGLDKADAQATLYGPTHFLALHNDSHVMEGWRIAYVLNMGLDEWRPDWGGYLLFFDDDGDVTGGFKPRFNSLNLFAVPQSHNVSYVPPFAPQGRMAVTGWIRDK